MKKIVSMLAVAGLMAGGTAIAANTAAGKEKAKVCAACHGADGNSASAEFPRLAGQHADYLVKSMERYKSGARKNPIMAPMAANLSQHDMEDLAAYFSTQTGLVTFK
jgi:cytochrome c553